MSTRRGILVILGPGLLIAATGVGAGDLATAGFAGSHLGLAIAWAVVLGAFLKFVLNEGLTRWQLATGTTLLEGAITHFGWPLRIAFILYFLPWSFFTGAALISACGVTASSILPFDDPALGKIAFGAIHSAIGVAVAWFGGFRAFERIMAACIGIMFFSVIATAIMLRPDWGEVAAGLIVPRMPEWRGEGLTWTIALMGGVGGTVTILCYGYWIREEGRTDARALRTCRLDLASGYIMTGLFGIAMLIIASGITVQGTGSALIANLADQIGATAGAAGRWVFLIGAWAAVFSSLLGVWQAVPYLFADFWRMTGPGSGAAYAPSHAGPEVPRRSGSESPAGPEVVRRRRSGSASGGGAGSDAIAMRPVSVRSTSYRLFLIALAVLPLLHIHRPFRDVQQVYAIVGAAFIPMLALLLLVMNGNRGWVGPLRNRWPTVVVLIATLAFFIAAGVMGMGD